VKIFLSRNNLLVIVFFLAGINFALVPLYEFQSQQNEKLIAKSRQLEKLQLLLEGKDLLESDAYAVNEIINEATSRFYADSGTVKLDIQKQCEKVFDQNAVVMNSFDWVSDTGEVVRTLRASVRFSGKTRDVITAFWDIARFSNAVKIVSWSQRIQNNQRDSMGSSKGDLVIEFYAVKPQAAALSFNARESE
jgi:hypothetical protein